MLLAARERRALVATPARAAAIGLWFVYLLSGLVNPAVPRAALGEILKQGLYLGVFLAASDVVWSAVRARHGGAPASRWAPSAGAGGLALGLWGAVVLMALLSLLAAAGLIPCNFIRDERLYTYVGYANAAGALFAGAFLLGLGLRRMWARLPAWFAVLIGVGQWALLTGVVLTFSRGVWVILPLAVTLLLAAWPCGRRLVLVLEILLLTLPALAVAPLWVGSLGQRTPGVYLFLAGIVLAASAGWLCRRIEGFGRRRWVLVLFLAFALVGAGAGSYQAGHLPEGLAGRLSAFLTDRSVWERIEWTRDAVAMALDHPILGVGGGGWDPRYFQYQRYSYYTTEVHNGYAETWAETGTLGLLALLSFFGASLLGAWRLAKARQDTEPETAPLVAGLGAGTVVLVVHSALDLDLSVGSLGLFLWAMFGVVDGLVAEERERRLVGRSLAGDRRWPRVVAAALAVAASLVAASLFAALRVEARAAALYSEGKYEESRDAFALASRLDPLSSRLRAERGAAIQAQAGIEGARDPSRIEEARVQFAESVRLNPYDPDAAQTYATFLLYNVSASLAVGEFEQALKLQPSNAARYELLAEVDYAVGLQSLRAGDPRTAGLYLTAATDIGRRMAAWAAHAPPETPPDFRLPFASPALALQMGKAWALLGEYAEAFRELDEAHDESPFPPSRETPEAARDRHAEAVIWLSLVGERLGDPEMAAAYLAEARSIVANVDAIRADLGPLLGTVDGP